jgi:hypothetical protein
MNTKSLATTQSNENQNSHQSWIKPDLIDYGTVGDLTQGASSGGTETNSYTSVAG